MHTSAGTPTPPQPRRRVSPGAVLTVVNGVLAGIGAVYATTRSVTITMIAAVVAVVVAALTLLLAK